MAVWRFACPWCDIVVEQDPIVEKQDRDLGEAKRILETHIVGFHGGTWEDFESHADVLTESQETASSAQVSEDE